jgi:glycosyltransferase involved in cell wall biosynthesis
VAGPLVDVGVPTHGRPAFVTEAIDSVLAQTFRGWRLLVSEDGPGGGLVEEAVQPYLADERISYAATGERVGAAGNMSRLLQSGDAQYVIVLHDDDLWDPEVLERRVGFLEEHPGCGFVFSGHYDIDATGRRIGSGELRLAEGVHPPETLAPIILRSNVMAIMGSVLVRRTAYEAVGPAFDASFPRIFDWEMWGRLAVESAGGFLAVRDVAYRRHDEQISGSAGQADEFLRLYDRIDERLAARRPEVRPPAGERARVRARLLLSSAFDALEAGDGAAARAALRRARSTRRSAVLDPRFAVAALTALGGRPARALLSAARRARYRRSDRPDRPEAAG